MLTLQQFKKLFPNAITPEETYNGLVAAIFEYEIMPNNRWTMFLAQLAHESGGFRWDHELGNKSYFKKYDGRKDLDNLIPGDGYKYRGRGWIQLTGRHNYGVYSKKLGVDFITHPDLASNKMYAAKIAAQYWVDHGCNALADSGNFTAITKKINGGTNGLADRKAWLAKIQKLV